MSVPNYVLTEEQLLCCICLDVFTDPVTLPCGHNFCKNCITQHLNVSSQRQCPMCKEGVDRKYKLGVNTFISEMAVQFRRSAGRKVSCSSEQHVAQPGDVSFHVPTRTKRTAVKSCLLLALGLACLSFYFATNVTLHQTASGLETDQLFDSGETAAGSMCNNHGKPLELYCKSDQESICRTCADTSHRLHHVVALEEEHEVKKTELRKMEAEIHQMIQERQLKVREIKHSAKLSKEAAGLEMADGVQVFTPLIQSLERAKAELIRTIEGKQKTTEEQAEGFIQELEQEISELMRRRAEVEQLSRSEDHLHVLKSFPSHNTSALTRDWRQVPVCPALYEGILRTTVVSAVDQLIQTVTYEIKKMQEAEQKSVRQFEVEVTLDPDTAHPALILSDDGKQVHYGDDWKKKKKKLPDSSKRFELALFVLGKQSLSCGRFHYYVEVKGKTVWILGVAKESVDRKTEIQLNPENGVWAIFLRNNKQLFALTRPSVLLSTAFQPEKVGVFVDYNEGRVSFYDVDAAALLYSFTGCSFTEKLFPLFSPGTSDGGMNSAPLIISPVNQYAVN